MIVIKIVGGLASQLHKYAVVRSIAEKNNTDYKVDLSAYENMDEDDDMYYGLPNIGFDPLVASKQDITEAKSLTFLGRFLYSVIKGISWIPSLHKSWSKRLNRLVLNDAKRNLIYKNFLTIHISNKSSLNWMETVNQSKNCYIEAEFGLDLDIIENLRSYLKETVLNTKVSDQAQIYLDQIMSSPISISMHIRRGDYVTNKATNDFHGVCGKQYYKKALERYQGIEQARVFVFSDDLPWVGEEFRDLLPTNSVLVSDNENYEDFSLMCNCSNHIIANSGFSSMSAWLSGTDEANITAPARWFMHEETNNNTIKMLPKGWTYL